MRLSLRRAALAAVVVVLASGCPRAEKPAPAKRRDRVRVNVSAMLKFGHLAIAKDEGFFAAEGIDAEFVQIDQNSGLLAVSNGDLDVFVGPVRSGLFNAMLRGAPIQVVADAGHFEPMDCVAEAFAAPTAMADRIAAAGGSPRGERVASINGGVTEYLIERMLARHGLTVRDVETAQVPQGEYLSRSNRKMDAIRYMTEPQLSEAVGNGSMKILVDSEVVAPGHQHAVVTYGRRLLRDDPELGRRFMRAYLRGVGQYRQGKTERNIAILSRHAKLPPEIIRASCLLPIAVDGRVEEPAIQPLLDWFLAKGYLEAPIARSVWWNGDVIAP